MTNPDYRAMCAELLRSLENYPVQPPRDRDLCVRARVLLAQPVAEGPTDQELLKAFLEATTANMRLQGGLSSSDANGIARQLDAQRVAGLRAILARYGRPAAAPVPEPGEVAELVLMLRPAGAALRLHGGSGTARACDRAAELLETNALPTPEATND